jgi:H+/Na+-translocating ferredoxin:NAD+ oxidoreductase subunit B
VNDLVEQVDAVLPQTQCTRCGYPACRPYAEAIVEGSADINQCPPGGEVTIRELARLLGRIEKPLNSMNGVVRPPTVAFIDEARCIGCAKCLPACPVDAIVGAQRFMHTVVAELCTGCDLCLPPCPVDCIELRPALDVRGDLIPPPLTLEELQRRGRVARERYEAGRERRRRNEEERQQLIAAKKQQAGTWRKLGAAP